MTIEELNILKLHELLDIAIKDLLVCIEDPRVEINMGEWYTRFSPTIQSEDQRTCAVCLAGSVIRETLKLEHIKDWNFIPKFAKALDDLRQGEIYSAFYKMNSLTADFPTGCDEEVYMPFFNECNPARFVEALQELQLYLKGYDI